MCVDVGGVRKVDMCAGLGCRDCWRSHSTRMTLLLSSLLLDIGVIPVVFVAQLLIFTVYCALSFKFV